MRFRVGGEVSNCMTKRKNCILMNLVLSFTAQAVGYRGGMWVSLGALSEDIAL